MRCVAGTKPPAAFLTTFACYLGKLTDVLAQWRAGLPESTVLFSAHTRRIKSRSCPHSYLLEQPDQFCPFAGSQHGHGLFQI